MTSDGPRESVCTESKAQGPAYLLTFGLSCISDMGEGQASLLKHVKCSTTRLKGISGEN